MGEDSIMGPRALREIYLRPFQIAQKRSKPWAYMTAYNKLNGLHCSENQWLLRDLLRGEWGFDGLIMSDWYGTYSVSESVNAGLNLEMPGGALWRDPRLVMHLIYAHKIDIRQVDRLATGILKWVQKLAKVNEELVYAPPSDERTRTEAKEEDAKILRRLASEGIVLLKNDKEILPIKSKKVAVIGPNAKARVLTGGGSALLRSAWSVSPWEGLVENKPKDVELDYSLGARTSKYLPLLGEDFTAPDGSKGFEIRHYAIEGDKQAAQPAVTERLDVSDLNMGDFSHPDLGKQWFTEIVAVFTSPVDGEYEFGICVTGQAWVWVDGELVVENTESKGMGSSFFGCGTEEVRGSMKAQKGKVIRVQPMHLGSG